MRLDSTAATLSCTRSILASSFVNVSNALALVSRSATLSIAVFKSAPSKDNNPTAKLDKVTGLNAVLLDGSFVSATLKVFTVHRKK